MRRTYTSADYEIKQGRFLILSTMSGDKYTEVPACIVEGSDEADRIAFGLQDSGNDHLIKSDSYLIHEGFIIASAKDPRGCAAILMVKEQSEANESLTRFLDDLNAYDLNAC